MANILDKIMHNGDEYDLPEGIPSGGTDGQFLGKVSGDTAWTDAPVTSVNGSTGAVTVNDTKVASSAPTATEGTLWYDSANDKLKAYNGSSWDEIGGGITKVFELSSTSDLTTAQAAVDHMIGGGISILHNGGMRYTPVISDYANVATSTYIKFCEYRGNGNVASGIRALIVGYQFTLSSGTVTGISAFNNTIALSSSAPTSGDNSRITLVI